MEKKVITEYNNNSDTIVVNEIINSINNLNIESKLSEDNKEKYDTESKKYEDIKSSDAENEILLENNFNEEDELSNVSDFNEEDLEDFEYSSSTLFERLLLNEKFIPYKELLLGLNNNKNKQNRISFDNDFEDELLNMLENINVNQKKKLIYPKKK